MIFDVIAVSGYNEAGKKIINIHRIHDSELSKYLRSVQDVGGYIMSVRPLFRNRNIGTKVNTVEMPYDASIE
jgi:hypothetical protein